MRLAIDTSRYVDLARGVEETVTMVRCATRVAVPLVVVGELRAGFLSGTKSKKNEKHLTRFLSRERASVLTPDQATTHLYARIFTDLRQKRTPIPTNDIWIAALAMQHDLPLYTRDRHFDHVVGLALL